MQNYNDDEELKDHILEGLMGEVDDYTGSKLPDDLKEKSKHNEQGHGGGVTVSIVVSPSEMKDAGSEPGMKTGNNDLEDDDSKEDE